MKHVCELSDEQLKQALSSKRHITPPQQIGDFSLVEWGGHRYVYAYGDCVIKITVPQDGKNNLHNEDEWKTWQKAPEDLKEVLTPVLDHAEDFSWITMPKAQTLRTGLGIVDADIANKEIRGFLNEKGFQCFDLSIQNVGLVKGKPVIVDYGFGVHGGKNEYFDICDL